MIVHGLLALIVALALVNGIYAPAWNFLFGLQGFWYPSFLKPNIQTVTILASVFLSFGYFLISGIPAALLERIMRQTRATIFSRVIWLVTLLAMSWPTLQRF